MSGNTGDESGFVPVAVGQFVIQIKTSSAVEATAIAINLFQSSRTNIPGQPSIYSFAPYFVFCTQGSSKYSRFKDANNSLIKLRLALYDDGLKKASAEWLSSKTEQLISSQQLQILPYLVFAGEGNFDGFDQDVA